MIDDAVSPPEAGGGDDFLVKDAFAFVSAPLKVAMRGVAFGRDGAEMLVGWHDEFTRTSIWR